MPSRYHTRLKKVEECVTPQQARWLFSEYARCLDIALAHHGVESQTRATVLNTWLSMVDSELSRWPALMEFERAQTCTSQLMEALRRLVQHSWTQLAPLEPMWQTLCAEMEKVIVP